MMVKSQSLKVSRSSLLKVPGLKKSFYVIATPGTKIALPEIGGGAAAEFPISLTVNEYKGLDTAIEPKAASGN